MIIPLFKYGGFTGKKLPIRALPPLVFPMNAWLLFYSRCRHRLLSSYRLLYRAAQCSGVHGGRCLAAATLTSKRTTTNTACRMRTKFSFFAYTQPSMNSSGNWRAITFHQAYKQTMIHWQPTRRPPSVRPSSVQRRAGGGVLQPHTLDHSLTHSSTLFHAQTSCSCLRFVLRTQQQQPTTGNVPLTVEWRLLRP